MKYAEVRKAAEGYCDNEWKKETDLQVRQCIDKLTIPAFIERCKLESKGFMARCKRDTAGT